MKRTKFRLEPVLRIRRLEERAAALVAAQEATLARTADTNATEKDQAAGGAGVVSLNGASAFIGSMVRSGLMASDASTARAQSASQDRVAEEANGTWTVAAQRMKGLERLKDRHVEAVHRAIEHAEIRTVDDIVNRTYAVQPKTDGSN